MLTQTHSPTSVDTEPAHIQTWELTKTYRTGFWLNQTIPSLKNCTLTVRPGETFGLLGPNGAGKTTLLKVLLGIVRPTSGRAVLLGRPIGDRSVKQRIGYLPENAYLYDFLTGWEFLEFSAELFQIPRSVQQKRLPYLFDLVGLALSAAKKKQMRQYSKGMQQRVGLAQALVNDPELVFLDEPMSGLDPVGRYQIRQIILSLKEQGKTIFFNSHVLSDVEQICDRIALLGQGELLCSGSLDELLGTGDAYQVAGKGGNIDEIEPWVCNFSQKKDGTWHGRLEREPEAFIARVRQNNGQLLELKRARASLEEFFVEQLQKRGITSSR